MIAFSMDLTDGSGVTRGPRRAHAQEDRVAVAVVPHLLDREDVSGRLPLAPQLLSAATEVDSPPGAHGREFVLRRLHRLAHALARVRQQ